MLKVNFSIQTIWGLMFLSFSFVPAFDLREIELLTIVMFLKGFGFSVCNLDIKHRSIIKCNAISVADSQIVH